jgi:N-methylhydantoinase A
MDAMRYMIAADTGGTFTDVAVYDAQEQRVVYGKTLTNYDDLVEGALEGLSVTGVDLARTSLFKHGTTHVINTFIERSGAKTALVTTQGFRDSLEIGRGNRPVPFALEYRRDPPLIARIDRYEVDERIDAQGNVLRPLDSAALRRLAADFERDGIEAVAVSFINAYVNPVHEEAAVNMLRGWLPGVYVTAGTTLTREWFEYERTSTAAANAYVGARMESYIETFDLRLKQRGFDGRLYMMGSNGGVLSVERTREQPVALVESGPIGGCIGAAEYARALGRDKLIAFDMGGTTAKCALVQDGHFEVQSIYYVGGYERGFPLKTPVVDIVEVGAGGGSIASVDDGGRLSVGPRSAGSEPGPVAFGRGGIEPTVTDANLVLGRISASSFMKGKLSLDTRAAFEAVRDKVAAPLGYDGAHGVDAAAQGILDLATTTMASAIKEITIERGHDVREYDLFVFGGGGPLFGSILARSLGIPTVIVPPHPGNFSTLGMLISGARLDLSRTVVLESRDDALDVVSRTMAELEDTARTAMRTEMQTDAVEYDRSLDMRYRGQKHTVRVPYEPGMTIAAVTSSFQSIYKERYGHANANNAVEILGVRIGAMANIPKPQLSGLSGGLATAEPTVSGTRSVFFPEPHGRLDVPVWRRDVLPAGWRIDGPAIVEEYSSTTVLLPGDVATVGSLGEITIRCGTH